MHRKQRSGGGIGFGFSCYSRRYAASGRRALVLLFAPEALYRPAASSTWREAGALANCRPNYSQAKPRLNAGNILLLWEEACRSWNAESAHAKAYPEREIEDSGGKG